MNTAEHIAGEPAISVIVPIYNVEPYLSECLDSLCGQTLRNIEIIGVDDGSTDGSGALLDEYAAKDKRIIAVHQKNAGVSAARNAGMRLARGEYLAFVDGDDWMERTAYEDILQKLQGRRPDIVIFRHTSIYGGETAIGTYYNGATLNGINKKYASDKNWANSVYSHMQYLYNKL